MGVLLAAIVCLGRINQGRCHRGPTALPMMLSHQYFQRFWQSVGTPEFGRGNDWLWCDRVLQTGGLRRYQCNLLAFELLMSVL